MEQIVEINLHGNNWDLMPKQTWKLAVKSVCEAVHAINIMSRNKFFGQLLENDKKNIKYEILINKNPCLYVELPSIEKPESLLNSELVINYYNLQTIDIVPVIEGAEDIGLIIAGIALIAVGMIFFGAPSLILLKGAFIFGGLGLVAAGVMNLLTTPPKLEDFKGPSRRGSYLFDGPENTVGEGGPVPLIYGQLLVGSHTVAQTYHISDRDAGQLITT